MENYPEKCNMNEEKKTRFVKKIKQDFPFLSHQESKELIEELYKFLERFYSLQIAKKEPLI